MGLADQKSSIQKCMGVAFVKFFHSMQARFITDLIIIIMVINGLFVISKFYSSPNVEIKLIRAVFKSCLLVQQCSGSTTRKTQGNFRFHLAFNKHKFSQTVDYHHIL